MKKSYIIASIYTTLENSKFTNLNIFTFIIHRNPNLQSTSNPWPKYDLKKKGYLTISQYLTVGYNYRPDAVEFWSKYLYSLVANSAPCPTDTSTNLPITVSTNLSNSPTTVSVSSSGLTVTRKLLIVTIILSVLSAIFILATVVLAALLFRRSTSSKSIAKF